MDVDSEEDHVLGYQKALFSLNILLRNINDSIKEGDNELYRQIILLFFCLYNFSVPGVSLESPHHKISIIIF